MLLPMAWVHVHIAIFEVFWIAMHDLDWAADTPLGTAVTALAPVLAVLAAHALWRYVEQPARRRLRQLGPFEPGSVRGGVRAAGTAGRRGRLSWRSGRPPSSA